jgi:hypothetical protein
MTHLRIRQSIRRPTEGRPGQKTAGPQKAPAPQEELDRAADERSRPGQEQTRPASEPEADR